MTHESSYNPFWEAGDQGSSPFEDDVPNANENIDSLLQTVRTPVPSQADPTETFEEKTLTWEQVASFLLKKNFNLTALELHSELHERGITLPRLRDFFSNPGNFECVREANLPDGDYFGNRLNRASSSQTLDSLDFARESSEVDSHDRVDERVAVLEFELRKSKETIQSLREQLTCLTTSSDNTKINPAERDSNILRLDNLSLVQPLENRALDFLINEYLLQNQYKLTSITFTDECQNLDFDDWDDVGLLEAKPPALNILYRNFRHGPATNFPDKLSMEKKIQMYDAAIQCDFRHDNSISSMPTEGQQDVKELLNLRSQVHVLITSLQDSENKCHRMESEINRMKSDASSLVSNLDQNASLRSHHPGILSCESKQMQDLPEILSRFHASLSLSVFPKTELDAESLQILRKISEISTDQRHVIHLLAETILQIIPNILLGKRQDVIPLLLVTILLHEDHSWRDKLVHQLFNLLKKPEETQRRMILSGCERFAHLASTEQLEGELLPQCWTQISHKYVEKRLLVAEACAVLVPFISPLLSGSLLLSIAKQVLTEDKNVGVREKMVRSLALVDLLQITLSDSSDAVLRTSIVFLLPTMALWTRVNLNALGPKFIEPYFINQLGNVEDDVHFLNRIAALKQLVPHIFADVVCSGPWRNSEQELQVAPNILSQVQKMLPVSENSFNHLKILISEDYLTECGKLQCYIDREWFQEWTQLKWVKDIFIPSLCRCSAAIPVQKAEAVIILSDLFQCIVNYFGHVFAAAFISPGMKGKIQELGSHFLSHAVFVCFACSVVALCEPQQLKEFLSSALVSISDQSLPLDGLQLIFRNLCPLFVDDVVQVCWVGIVHHSIPVRLNSARLLRSLTEILHPFPVYLESLIPPLITLASDTEPRIRIEIIPSLCNILFERIQEEKVLTVLQGFMGDRDHLDIVDETVRNLAKGASRMDKRFHQEFFLPHLAVIVAQNPRLQVYRKDMAISLLDAYVSLACSEFGEESWLTTPMLQSLRSLLQEMKELSLQEYLEIAQELCDKLGRLNSNAHLSSTDAEAVKMKSYGKISNVGLTGIFRKK